jgi:hypothetical protein
MKKDYIITNEECAEKGLDLNEYALSGDLIPALINRALDISITRCCYNYDGIETEEDLETKLDEQPTKVKVFKKLQFNVLWNLIFSATDDPVDVYIDTIISKELNLGKINGVQKGIWYKNY